MQTEPPCQHFQCIPDYLLRLLAQLPVKFRVVMRIHPALECLRIIGPIKEARSGAQRADPVTGSPCGADFVGLAGHVFQPNTEGARIASALAELDRKLHGKFRNWCPLPHQAWQIPLRSLIDFFAILIERSLMV